ncbi:MBL fold metallo-hydrolase [Candidatus Bipolaricaulota bacterium]|nr:MBL fold metallo-hydrolase [Candidatus Bipolaricaulota bacterium]
MDSAVNLKILYDNTLAKEGFISGWGFSVLVQYWNKQILFDSGADPQILSRNIDQLNNPVDPDRVVISHPHCDHVGGLSAVLKEVSHCPVDLPSGAPENLTHKVSSYGCNPVPRPEPDKITKGLHTTGSLETAYRGLPLYEQRLIVEGTRGPAPPWSSVAPIQVSKRWWRQPPIIWARESTS